MREAPVGRKDTVILMFAFFAGVFLLLYPSVSDYWNSFTQSGIMNEYVENIKKIDSRQYQEIWESALAYNQSLAETGQHWYMQEEELERYYEELNVAGTGIMGYIDIPMIKCSLPIYHGTDDGVLQIAIGHIEGTALPVGGESTHCVLSGHRGLPSARLFTDLNLMDTGDLFYIRTLDETLTYEVDQVRIVEPEEVDELEIVEGRDLCTLVTCTPYGINSHRLLVRGHRIETTVEGETIVRVTAEALQISTSVVAIFLAVPLFFMWTIWIIVRPEKEIESRIEKRVRKR